MWFPQSATEKVVFDIMIKAMDSDKYKTELNNRIRIHMDTSRNGYKGNTPTYDSLTMGTVNMQAKMAASGYQTYGNVVFSSNQPSSADSVYKSMKNKINYGAEGIKGKENNGRSKKTKTKN